VAVQTDGYLKVKNSYRYKHLQEVTIRLSVAIQNKKSDSLSFLLHPAGPLLMLLSMFMFRSCLLKKIYLFQDKSF
jgi:hypothetical protein